MSLADQIIEHGPYYGGDLHPFPHGVDQTEINALRDELITARAMRKVLAGPYMTYASAARDGDSAMLGVSHDECPSTWYAEVEDFAELGELVRRAAEHAEVCG